MFIRQKVAIMIKNSDIEKNTWEYKFYWTIFCRIRSDSKVLFLYGRTQVSKILYSRIFYAVRPLFFLSVFRIINERVILFLYFNENCLFTKSQSEFIPRYLCVWQLLNNLHELKALLINVISIKIRRKNIKSYEKKKTFRLIGIFGIFLKTDSHFLKEFVLFASMKVLLKSWKCFKFHVKSSFRSWDGCVFALTLLFM